MATELTDSACFTQRRANSLAYVLITPAKNEAKFIESTINAVLAQRVLPARWVIVSDSSTDGTDELVQTHAAQHQWIELVRKHSSKKRHFAAKVDAFNAGYARVKDLAYQVIGNLDADISFDDKNYFEYLMTKFSENPRLGVCGTSYREGDAIYPRKFSSIADVFGACQLFRRECFETIGGYEPLRSGGIDVLAVLKAQSEGWETRTFTEKVCVHHRPVSSAHCTGFWERFLETGRKDYLLGSHPGFEIFRGLYQMKNKPYVVGGLLMLIGYECAMFGSVQRTIPAELVKLRQNDQIQRLKAALRRALCYPL
ncbi:MAG: glycosyltransferase family 2 protein [Acidobacteriia bacterium]|nr:glycosyltransferase family 2 protein [Terriglobia bacterium]